MSARFTIPINLTFKRESGALKPATIFKLPPINLFANSSPTMMEVWLIESMNIPGWGFANFKTAQPASLPPSVTANAVILWGGERVGSLSVTQQLAALDEFKYNAAFRIAGQFPEPIEVPRGRTLLLLLEYAFNGTGELGEATGGLGGFAVNNDLEPSAEQGAINYSAQALSGHRTL